VCSSDLVEARAIIGSVRSANGNALARANVCARALPNRCCALTRCALSEQDGRFELEHISNQVDVLLVSAPGHLPREHTLTAEQADAPSVDPITITLEPGGVEVTGVVVDASGGAVPGALV